MVYRYHHVLFVMLLVGITGFAAEFSLGVKTHSTFSNVTHIVKSSLPYEQQPEDVVHRDDSGLSNLPWFIAGSLLGGYVCVAFRRIALGSEAARYFTVSVVCGLLAAPILSYDCNLFPIPRPRWYQCFAMSGACAGGAWGILELATLLFGGIYKAGQERGVAGVRDQIVLILSLGMIGRQSPPAESNRMETTSTPDATKTNSGNKP